MLRSVDRTYENLLKLAEWGYPFPHDEDGKLYIANLGGPDYMAFMRRRVLRAGVTVLDHPQRWSYIQMVMPSRALPDWTDKETGIGASTPRRSCWPQADALSGSEFSVARR